MQFMTDSSMALLDMGESSNLFTSAPFACKDGWQKGEGNKEKEISLYPVCLYMFRLRFLYKPSHPGSLQVVFLLSCDMLKKAALLLGSS